MGEFQRPQFIRLPSSGGTSPPSWGLAPSRRCSSFGRLPRLGGMPPVNPFSERLSFCRPARLPNSGGIAPVSSLALSSSILMLVSSPSSAGISPDNALRPSCNSSSRVRGPSSSSSTPSHSCMGMSADQFNLALPASVSLISNSVPQSATRSGLSRGSGTATPTCAWQRRRSRRRCRQRRRSRSRCQRRSMRGGGSRRGGYRRGGGRRRRGRGRGSLGCRGCWGHGGKECGRSSWRRCTRCHEHHQACNHSRYTHPGPSLWLCRTLPRSSGVSPTR